MLDLDAVLKGNNLALKYRLNTKAANEMLIWRRQVTLTSLVKDCNLSVDVTRVRSDQNRADLMTRVPQRWLNVMQKEIEPIQPVFAFAASNSSLVHLT